MSEPEDEIVADLTPQKFALMGSLRDLTQRSLRPRSVKIRFERPAQLTPLNLSPWGRGRHAAPGEGIWTVGSSGRGA